MRVATLGYLGAPPQTGGLEGPLHPKLLLQTMTQPNPWTGSASYSGSTVSAEWDAAPGRLYLSPQAAADQAKAALWGMPVMLIAGFGLGWFLRSRR